MKFAVAAALFAGAEGLRSGTRTSCGAKGAAASSGVNISIVNGQPASECEWKWQVGLRRSRSASLPFCGGMLINEDWVLTAAHCGSSPTFYVVAGDYNANVDSGNEQVRQAVQVINHPSYSSSPVTRNDFSLVRLDAPMNFNSCVGSVCLPEQDADVDEKTECWITGWGTLKSSGGRIPQLQEVAVNIVSNSDCVNKFGYTSNQIDETMLCAQGIKADGSITDACQGDSGGPLVCEDKQTGAWMLHGATSWGRGCAGANYPGIWARVTDARDWIDETLAANAGPVPEPVRCPDFARSPSPDGDGDCQCKAGLRCSTNNNNVNCPTSGSLGGFGGTYFLPDCTNCQCIP